jgi:hypothetical protein
VLKRDRAVLDDLIAGFNASTRQAEDGIERLRDAVDGAGRQIARQIDAATTLKDDLILLIERGNRLADRLDSLVRAGRPLGAEPPRVLQAASEAASDAAGPRVRSQAERDLIKALRMPR